MATWFDVDISNFPVENVKDKEHHLKFTKPKKFDYELLRGKSKDENMMVEESKTNGFTPSSDGICHFIAFTADCAFGNRGDIRFFIGCERNHCNQESDHRAQLDVRPGIHY